jgi:hypothetical protein
MQNPGGTKGVIYRIMKARGMFFSPVLSGTTSAILFSE